MTNEQLNEMERALEGVHPSPWHAGCIYLGEGETGPTSIHVEDEDNSPMMHFEGDGEEFLRLAEHIARYSPDTIRALIETVREARENLIENTKEKIRALDRARLAENENAMWHSRHVYEATEMSDACKRATAAEAERDRLRALLSGIGAWFADPRLRTWMYMDEGFWDDLFAHEKSIRAALAPKEAADV